MYEKHFAFKYKPFELVPNPDFLFQSSTHKKAITYLDYGIKEKIGFILLTGEIGSGKTTVMRNLVKRLDSSIKLSRINNTKVTSEQLIAMINEDFGLEVDGKSKTKLLSELNKFLIEQYSRHIQPVLLIDEAQNLSPELLEEIRLLSNLETDKSKLLQIILVGQPELKKTLMLPALQQLRQRININYHIAPLTTGETADYIKYRLTVAGNSEAIEINDEIIELVYRFSKGIPRLINILCDFALLTAYVEGNKQVSLQNIRDVESDLESYNYWSEGGGSHDDPGTEPENAEDMLKEAGGLALRLIKLEETVQGVTSEVGLIKEKLEGLENNLPGIAVSGEENSSGAGPEGNAGSEQVEDDKDGKGVRAEAIKPAKQVESLKKILSDINSKLKKT